MMQEYGRPLSLQEITSSLASAGRIHGPHLRQTVRTAIIRQPHKFVRVGRGVYRLKNKTADASSADVEV
jgi:hypothetical protein